MTLKNVYQTFLKIEDDLNLFSYFVDDVYIWEMIRFDVFQRIIIELGLFKNDTMFGGKSFSSLNFRHKIKMCNTLLFDSIFYNPFFIRHIDFIFFGHPRRKLMYDGYYWDIYTDPIIPILDNYTSATIETHESLAHLKPAKTKNLYHNGIFTILSNINEIISKYKRTNIVHEFAKGVENRIKQDLAVSVDVYGLTIKTISRHKSICPILSNFFKKTTPKICFTMASYGATDVIISAKRLNIPVVELQHGTMSRYHLGYSYEDGRVKRAFPDYLFSFGDFWRDSVDFPIPKERVLSVGYPHLENFYEEKKSNEKIDQIVFLSQWSIGVELSKFAVQTAKKFRGRANVVYKLHPWEKINESLIQASEANLMQVVTGQTPSLYDLLSTSRWIVGVYSTAIYEGIALGCIPFIVNLTGFDYMEFLLQKGFAKLVKNPEEIDLSFIPVKINKDYLFADNWRENFKKGVGMVLDNSKGKRG